VEAEAVKFLWQRKHFEEEAGSGTNSETWGRDVEAVETEANSEVTNFIRS